MLECRLLQTLLGALRVKQDLFWNALSDRQLIHMKCQAVFSLKNKYEKIKMSSAVVVISTFNHYILWANSADNKLGDTFLISYFSQKKGFYILCKLPPLETICMKCQILFPGKIRKIFQNVIC